MASVESIGLGLAVGGAEAGLKPAATEKFRELKRLLDEGVINTSEFEAKKAELPRDL